MTAILERVLVVFNADGTFKGAHAEDARGLAMPVTGEQLASVLPQVGDLMGRVQAAEAEAEYLSATLT